MSKILLVEDDNNLREIYEARLQAEGYTIVSAHDGEEALVVAKAEQPDLIISDVMMPKISGFEMLDILRNTDSLRNVKVIMLTALGQADDQQRADKLGSDRYLVKSQVTLEDIVNAANELLNPGSSTPPAAASVPSTTAPADDVTTPPSTQASEEPAATPVSTASTPQTITPTVSDDTSTVSSTQPAQTDIAKDEAEANTAETATEEQNAVKNQIASFIAEQNGDPQPTTQASSPPAPTVKTPSLIKSVAGQAHFDTANSDQTDTSSIDQTNTNSASPPPAQSLGYNPMPAGKKIIEPLPDTNAKPDINELLAKEDAKDIIQNTTNDGTNPTADTAPAQPPASPSNNTDLNNVAL